MPNSLRALPLRRVVTVAVLAGLLVLAVVVDPALAAESGEQEKFELARNVREWVGVFMLGVLVVAVLLAIDNARRQLKGERDQASGRFRWR